MNAIERGNEMMTIPMGQLPWLAVEFSKKLCKEVGVCGEVLLTAYIAYAQYVEKLPCDDDLYKIRSQDKEWLKNKKIA